ncbi:hypothetical protein [uncultured Brevundimonas sp.]|uniref:hypothetical protein n=1 Tax=uncultured Brevundimonas sp. TaxID=213418 RepID=UPI002625D006|nr:hypothetical protein [uncultured Brevundimonas sp.]
MVKMKLALVNLYCKSFYKSNNKGGHYADGCTGIESDNLGAGLRAMAGCHAEKNTRKSMALRNNVGATSGLCCAASGPSTTFSGGHHELADVWLGDRSYHSARMGGGDDEA